MIKKGLLIFLISLMVLSAGLFLSTPTRVSAANPSANLDQCANDPAPSPSSDGCDTNANQWVNGNLGASKSLYLEGDSISYRMLFDNLDTTIPHNVTIEWDTTKSSKHAIDYIDSFNQSVLDANPCLGVSGCGAPSPFSIPADPQVTGAGVTPLAGNLTIYGGTITAVSAYSGGAGFPTGDNSRRITITFTASQVNPVLAWGGHIATRKDWGLLDSAIDIPGSPYHTRLIDLDGSGGNQDRSLSAEAVVFPASITIIKAATPEGSTSFPFTASPSPLANFSLVDDGTLANTQVFSGIQNFTTYSVSESVPSGWSLTGIVCSVSDANGGTQSISGATVTIVLKEGELVTCTYSDQQLPAHLKLVKVVTNDNGGTAVATDFTLSAAGPTPISGAGGAESDVTAGTYALSETNVSGYTASSWVCVGGSQSDSSITLGGGQSATCTITNNDNAPALHLRKIVINDNGGTATVANFTLTADGTGANDLSGTSPVDSGAGLKADTFALSESSVSGYSASAWVCVGGSQSGSSITLALGQSATCTITNDDQTAHLKLVKVVVNDNGGSAVATDFTLSAAGPSPISGAGGVESDVNAGSYALSETSVSGYTAGSWVCVGGSQSGSSIALALGQSATCTITNDDQTAHLKLVKVVVNDNGGSAVANDFTLSAAGPSPISGAGGAESDVNAGSYALSETSVSGYAAGSWVCVGGSQSGSSIALALGQSATCTITNNDQTAHLKLVKVVVNDNGGSAVANDFTLSASGPTPISGAGGVESDVNAGSYTLSETSLWGYTASAWVCVGGTQSQSSLTLALGESATCTITNNDQPGVIRVIKDAKPATGSFSFTTTGAGYLGFTLTGDTTNNGNVNEQTLNAGTYTVQEGTQLGWILTGIGGSSDPNTPYNCTVIGSGGSSGVGDLNTQTATIDLKIGDTVVCIFENTGQGATRTQGFWATHTPLANIAWFGGTAFGHTFPGVASVTGIGDTLICGRPIDTLAKLMGGFWSSISKTSTGAKRSTLDQARMQLLQQLLAAELNASAFGSVPAGGSGMFAQWESALCGTNITAIKTALNQAAAFNTQGDSAVFTPGVSADSKYARSIADYAFWNVIV